MLIREWNVMEEVISLKSMTLAHQVVIHANINIELALVTKSKHNGTVRTHRSGIRQLQTQTRKSLSSRRRECKCKARYGNRCT